METKSKYNLREIVGNKIKSINFSKIDAWEMVKIYSKYIIILFYSVYVAALLYIGNTNVDWFHSKIVIVIFLFLIPLLFIIFVIFKFDFKELMNAHVFVMGILAIFSAILAYLIYLFSRTTLSKAANTAIFYTTIIVSSVIILVGLTIYYNVFMNEIKRQKGWSGFMMNFMFYLPCLISDYLQYLLSEYKNTPSIIFILFILEIILLLLFLYLPAILNAIFVPKGLMLLNGPSFLTPSNVIANSVTFEVSLANTQDATPSFFSYIWYFITNTKPITNDNLLLKNGSVLNKQYTSNFALSMWIYVNNTILGTNNQESFIFKYGSNSDSYGKPSITYLGNDKWRFMFSNKMPTNPKWESLPEFIVKMSSQKWHFIVFNYHDNMVDLFINGSLARNMNLNNNLPIRGPLDKITIGSEKPNNIPGAICNIRFYNTPLSSTQIAQSYNMLFLYNPPVNNL